MPSLAGSGATAVVVKWKSGPNVASAAVAVSSFMVLPGVSGSVPVAVTVSPVVSSRTMVQAPRPRARFASAAVRCCAPTASTTGCGSRRTDHSGVPRVAAALVVGAASGPREAERDEADRDDEHAHAEDAADDGAAARHRRAALT